MREIEFRGITAELPHKPVYGYLMSEHRIYQQYKGTFLVIPRTIGEYTGCRDYLGNRLYEHDIVRNKEEDFRLYYQIIFTDGKFKVQKLNEGNDVLENDIKDYVKVGFDVILEG